MQKDPLNVLKLDDKNWSWIYREEHGRVMYSIDWQFWI